MTASAARNVNVSRLQTWVKWLAIVTMVVDHIGAILLPELLVLRAVGRFAFPAFVGLIALNVAVRQVPVRRYLSLMALFAVLSQVPYWLAGFGGVNVFVTLGTGLVVWGLLRGEISWWWVATLVLVPWAQYGPAGVLAVTVAIAALQHGTGWLLAVSLGLALVAQGSLLWAVTTAVVLAANALIGAAVLAVAGHVPAVSRGPRLLFYAFYPVHLLMLVGIRVLL